MELAGFRPQRVLRRFFILIVVLLSSTELVFPTSSLFSATEASTLPLALVMSASSVS